MATQHTSTVPAIITPEFMAQLAREARARIQQARLTAMGVDWTPDEDEILDDRPRMRPEFKARMQAKGLQHELPPAPLTVVMVTDIKHTIDIPTCTDPECICYELQREASMQPKTRRKARRSSVPARSWTETRPLTSNQGFSLLK